MSFVVEAQDELTHYSVAVRAVSPERTGDYYAALLKMILNASKSPKEIIDFDYSDRQFSQARWIVEVQSGQINEVMWTATSKEREQLLRPIRVPIFKGLLGKRILVIRPQDQPKFAQVRNKQDLKKFVAGMGVNWPDADVLLANGFPVTLGGGKDNLYKMLKANRFDYFARGVTEIASETRFLADNSLVIENHLLVTYQMPIYFFVSKKNEELAQRLENGWKIILKNGEFEKFFINHPRIKAAVDELKKQKRTIIHLDNPYLPDETPLSNPEYWFDVSQYGQ
jgi:hypothetical protein